jgi:hypothetical protein
MRMLRTLLVVTVALGASAFLAGSGGASAPAVSTPSPKFCAGYQKVTKQLETIGISKGKYNGGALKKIGKSLSNLAKSASGKLKSDIKAMAAYFNAIGSQGNALSAQQYVVGHSSILKNYTNAATDFVTAGASCTPPTT